MKISILFRNLFSVIISFAIFLSAGSVFAANGSAGQQKITISGSVTSASSSQGLPGVSIAVKGTSQGTITDIEGRFTISAPSDATLIFSFIGFTSQEVAVRGRTTINVKLEETTEAIEEVVVTALGIKREEKSLGYSVRKVGGEELTRVVHENVLNSMAGKVSGVAPQSSKACRVRSVSQTGDSLACK